MENFYDIIVVGAGHAGCEAAHAAATMGKKVLLITMNMETIAKMSCNPAMGGVAKGQIIKEIDALGGMSGIITDKSMIQFRMLNLSKGPAMWSPRAQSDRMVFSWQWRLALEGNINIDFWQDTVKEIITQNSKACGVITSLGITFNSKAVILTNGTFLNGKIHIGLKNYGGGRMAESKVMGLTENLIQLGFKSGRMKTGTPPRMDGRSLDYSKMEEQKGDDEISYFSYKTKHLNLNQKSCYITYTNEKVHDILRTGFSESPMFNGNIEGVGPRYCPSIEDKINRFSERNRHQIFVEPEGIDTIEIYINGFSTSLPEEVQYEAIKQIEGFENAKMFRPGYAIEYDYFYPTQLKATLETKVIEDLYFAGQINGTTGYEEAASQGLIAGINAALKLQEKEPLILDRSEAYIGVLIDDLVTKGTEEPYRMFTSRAEFRILLRQDNADQRLTPIGNKIGLADNDRLDILNKKLENIQHLYQKIEQTKPTLDDLNSFLILKNEPTLIEKTTLYRLLLRPNIYIKDFINAGFIDDNQKDIIESTEIFIKYESYIKKEFETAHKINELNYLKLQTNFDYSSITTLSSEAKEKLNKVKPENIGQASRISGVNPADIAILLVKLGR